MPDTLPQFFEISHILPFLRKEHWVEGRDFPKSLLFHHYSHGRDRNRRATTSHINTPKCWYFSYSIRNLTQAKYRRCLSTGKLELLAFHRLDQNSQKSSMLFRQGSSSSTRSDSAPPTHFNSKDPRRRKDLIIILNVKKPNIGACIKVLSSQCKKVNANTRQRTKITFKFRQDMYPANCWILYTLFYSQLNLCILVKREEQMKLLTDVA